MPFSAAEKGVVKTTVETFSPDMGKEFSFSIRHFKMQLDDFIEGKNDMIPEKALAFDGIRKGDFVYGIKVYDRIIESIRQLGKRRDYDRRTLYMLYEWSELNYMRIQFLRERHIINFSREVEDMALVNYEEMRKGHYLKKRRRRNFCLQRAGIWGGNGPGVSDRGQYHYLYRYY